MLAITPRSLLSIHVADSASANALSRALGMDVSSQLVGTTLTAAPTFPKLTWRQELRRKSREWLQAAMYVAAVVAPGLVAYTTGSTLSLSLVLPLILFGLVLLSIRSVFRAATPARVYVGRDGLLLTTADRREFIGFERVKAVQSRVLAVTVTLTDRQVVKLPVSVRTGGVFSRKPHPLDEWVRDVDQILARRRTLVQQINDALTRFRNAGADIHAEAAARLLDRGSRPIPEWREALSLAHANTYREHHLDTDQLVNVFENPRVPLGQRLGAALALAGRPDEAAPEPKHKSRVSAAIASSANPKVRIALERAAEGKLDDADYERAVEAEAEAARMATGGRGIKRRAR